MKKLILLAAVACLAAVTTARAQKVYTEGTSIVLDLSVAAGMPAGVVTTTHKVFPVPDPDIGNIQVWSKDNLESGLLNQTVYHKLEIAKSDLDAAAVHWRAAVIDCREKTIQGKTGWRLPTQRELLYMLIFKTAIVGEGADAFANNTNYWSVTEHNGTAAYILGLGESGYLAADGIKGSMTWRARCVREM